MTYQIYKKPTYHNPTKEKIGKPYSCIKRARTRCNKLDLEYGDFAHQIFEIETGYRVR